MKVSSVRFSAVEISTHVIDAAAVEVVAIVWRRTVAVLARIRVPTATRFATHERIRLNGTAVFVCRYTAVAVVECTRDVIVDVIANAITKELLQCIADHKVEITFASAAITQPPLL